MALWTSEGSSRSNSSSSSSNIQQLPVGRQCLQLALAEDSFLFIRSSSSFLPSFL
jgi:hypothetical protein